MTQTCGNCRYFQQNGLQSQPLALGKREGMCHRFPPLPIVVPAPHGINVQPQWPPVISSWGCGEFMAKIDTG